MKEQERCFSSLGCFRQSLGLGGKLVVAEPSERENMKSLILICLRRILALAVSVCFLFAAGLPLPAQITNTTKPNPFGVGSTNKPNPFEKSATKSNPFETARKNPFEVQAAENPFEKSARLERERLEQERLERERIEQARLEQERADQLARDQAEEARQQRQADLAASRQSVSPPARRMLHFVAFDPFRRDSALVIVSNAITSSAIGVKLYPPSVVSLK